ncbi:MAG: ABC transporter ATP-binding protein [Spirochaetales bacterium]|nr:ABC transporter ATP-binding protein [Spirochaetales bacterium]
MIIRINNIDFSFGELNIISELSLEVRKEETICIIGPSGCGKTTLLNLISGSLEPDSGNITRGYKRLGYVFQEDRLLPWKTVRENISIVSPESSKEELTEIIKLVDLEGFEEYKPGQLSGGMRQRVSIARGFYYPAELLLMDEPLKSLDYNLRMSLLDSIIRLANHERRSLLYVTHEIDEALLLADRIIVLGKQPAGIAREFTIRTPQTERNLQSQDLTLIRNLIIEMLTRKKSPV